MKKEEASGRSIYSANDKNQLMFDSLTASKSLLSERNHQRPLANPSI